MLQRVYNEKILYSEFSRVYEGDILYFVVLFPGIFCYFIILNCSNSFLLSWGPMHK